MERRQRNLALWQAFIAAYLTVTAGAAFGDVAGPKVAGLLALLGAGMNTATVVYLAAIKPTVSWPDRSAGTI